MADAELGGDEVCLCTGEAVINHPAQMHVHISASLMKNTSPPPKFHKSLLNNKSLAREEILHKSRVHRPDSAHRCTVNLVCSCQAPVITHMQLRLQKSTPSSHPTSEDENYEKTVRGKTLPVTKLLPQAFLSCFNLLFTAKDRDLVLASVFFTGSQTICV